MNHLKPQLNQAEYGELSEALRAAYREDGDAYVLDLAPRNDTAGERMRAARRAEQVAESVHAQVIAGAVQNAGLPEELVTPIMERSRVVVGPDGTVDVRLYLDDSRTIEAPSTKPGVFHKTLTEHLDDLKAEHEAEQARQKKPAVNGNDIVSDRIVNGTRVVKYADGRIRIAGYAPEEFSRLSPSEQLRIGRQVSPPPKPTQAPRTSWPGIMDPSSRRPA